MSQNTAERWRIHPDPNGMPFIDGMAYIIDDADDEQPVILGPVKLQVAARIVGAIMFHDEAKDLLERSMNRSHKPAAIAQATKGDEA